jgi:hypothetical protein
MKHTWHIGALAGLLALSGCVTPPPSGPSIAVMPGQDKTFEAFQQDDYVCREFAAQRIGYASPAQAATQSAVGSAVVGTAVGAAAGALIGAAAGNPAAGAAIGAGSGLLVGGASGVGASQYSGAQVQQQYDIGYAQCMAARGNNVPQQTWASAAGWPAQGGVWAGPQIAVGVGGWWGPGWWGGPGWGWGGRPWGWGGGCCWGGRPWNGGWGGGGWGRGGGWGGGWGGGGGHR